MLDTKASLAGGNPIRAGTPEADVFHSQVHQSLSSIPGSMPFRGLTSGHLVSCSVPVYDADAGCGRLSSIWSMPSVVLTRPELAFAGDVFGPMRCVSTCSVLVLHT